MNQNRCDIPNPSATAGAAHASTDGGAISQLLAAIHELNVEVKMHRTHTANFMVSCDAIQRQLAELQKGQDVRLRDVEMTQARHDERINRVEGELTQVGEKVDELKSVVARWIGIGVGASLVIQLVFQLLPYITR